MKSLRANGITVCYDSLGDEDDDTILLISGLGTHMIRWTGPFCLSLVAKGFRVIRFDNRDAGLSKHFTNSPTPDFAALATAIAAGRKPDVPYTLDDMAADAIGLLDALSIERAHVVGRSMGGMIAQLMAGDHPQRVSSLASIMSSTGNPGLPSAAADIMAMLTRRAPHPVDDEEGFVAHGLAFANRIGGTRFPIDREAHRAMILEESRRAYDPAGFGRQVVHGSDDALIPPACGEDTAASIPGSEFLLIEGMGHDLPAALHQTLVDAICRNARRDIGK